MASKPILFSTPMVQAILEDRKSMTRRIINPQPCSEATQFERFIETVDCGFEARFGNNISAAICDRKPRYKVGDILWVRETWAEVSSGIIVYKATHREPFTGSTEIDHIGNKIKWRPSIHMPREAARIFIRVTNVRVERLQDITEEDALKEGAKAYGPNNCSGTSARIAFAELWDGVYNNWRENPWVWVYEFERVSDG